MNPRRSARNIKTSELLANPANIRGDLGELTELARSIQAKGVLNPLIVTEDPMHRGWLLLAGHRRLAASKEVGLPAVPCFIHHDIGDDQVEQTVVMIMENVHRKNLTPVEKAKAYGRLRDTGLNPTQISRRTGVHVSSVHTHLSLLDLDAKSLEAVEDGQLTAGEAIAAVRGARQEQRRANSTPERGRPVVAEPGHFTAHHPLARRVAALCDHSTRPRISVGCGQCWEVTIRENERQQRGEDPEPSRAEPSRAEPSRAEPSRAEPSRASTTTPAYDEAAVVRRLDGDHTVPIRNADREEIVRRAHRVGLNDRETARRAGLEDRTVLRIRQRLGLPANVDAGGNPVRNAS
jgi:ParB/RepB/Spo0J family partition protein